MHWRRYGLCYADKKLLKKFYQLNRFERIESLQQDNLISSKLADELLNDENLTEDQLEIFTENTITQFHLPVGLVKGLKVNGKKYLVPIATDEPSVVAALNKATHYVDIVVEGEKLPLIGQIFVTYNGSKPDIKKKLEHHISLLIESGNQAVPHLVQRGGGIKEIKFKFDHEFVISEVFVDTKEAMGANLVDTVVESIAPLIAQITKGDLISAILSNLPEGNPFMAKARVPISLIGFQAARKIVQLSDIASFNKQRAATNNKGVMNGVIGAVIASGNDDRAVSSAVYSSHCDPKDLSFTHWNIDDDNLIGEFSSYLPIGTVGGAISNHPDAKKCLALIQAKNSTELAHVVMAVGLASNFSAMYALVTDGIQKGHMRLHAKSIAKSVGIQEKDLSKVITEMIKQNKYDTLTVKKIIEQEENK